MVRVARWAERLATTLAILRVMPADFAAALGAVSQMRTHTSGDTAIPHRADCVVLFSGRHASLRFDTDRKGAPEARLWVMGLG